MYAQKFVLICVVISTLSLSAVNTALATNGSQCMMVVTYAEMASIQFQKASKAKSIDEASKFLKKGMDHAKEAASYCPQCDCNLAETYALEAFAIAKKEQTSTDLEVIHKQAQKAMNLSLDAMGAAQKCNE